MESSNLQSEDESASKPPQKTNWTVLVAVIVIGLIAIAAIWWYPQWSASDEGNTTVINSQPAVTSGVTPTPTSTATTSPTTTATPTPTATAVVVTNAGKTFEAALNNKDFAEAQTVLADNVNYIVEATECCGLITAAEAMTHLEDYIAGYTSINWSQDQQLVKQLKTNFPQNFPADNVVGIADNERVIAYKVGADGQIDDVYVVVSHMLFDLE